MSFEGGSDSLQRGRASLDLHKSRDLYHRLPANVTVLVDSIEKQNPMIAAAFIVALNHAVAGFATMETFEKRSLDWDEARKQTLTNVYATFQLMLRPEEFEQAAKLVFESDFWVHCLTKDGTSDEEAKKVEHIVHANRVIADFFAEDFGRRAITNPRLVDFGLGGGNTVLAQNTAMKAKGIDPKFSGVELSDKLIDKATRKLEAAGVNFKVYADSSAVAIDQMADLNGASACYSLHHLYRPNLVKWAVENGKIEVKNGCVWFNGLFIAKEVDFDTSKLEVNESALENSPQEQVIRKIFESLVPGGLFAIADPGSGLSKGFNTFMIEQGVKAAAGEAVNIGVNGLMEVGPSCFTSLQEMVEILERIGFDIELRVLQYHDAEGRYHFVQDQVIAAQLEGQRYDFADDYNLGYVVIARKPKAVSQLGEGINRALGNVLQS